MRRFEGGQAIVETALALSLFLVSVLGTVDLGRAGYTYNGLSNLAREASHYATLEFTSDSSSSCYWGSFDNASCLTAIKNYVVGLHMSAGLDPSNLSVSMTVECGNGTACSPGIPISVSISTQFQPVSTTLLGFGPFPVSATSTSQFVLPQGTPTPSSIGQSGGTATPGPQSTPAPTPTVVPEGAPSGISVSPDSGCATNCQTFNISWTPPGNTDALGHYDVAYGSAGNYSYSDPVPGRLGGSAVTNTTVSTGTQNHAICFEVIAVFADGTSWPSSAGWHESGVGAPVC